MELFWLSPIIWRKYISQCGVVVSKYVIVEACFRRQSNDLLSLWMTFLVDEKQLTPTAISIGWPYDSINGRYFGFVEKHQVIGTAFPVSDLFKWSSGNYSVHGSIWEMNAGLKQCGQSGTKIVESAGSITVYDFLHASTFWPWQQNVDNIAVSRWNI